MGQIGVAEVVVIILILVILFGAKNLPKIAKSIAEAVREFRKASRDDEKGT